MRKKNREEKVGGKRERVENERSRRGKKKVYFSYNDILDPNNIFIWSKTKG